jgi:hypothetical protein
MPVAIGEAMDLVLDRRAIARSRRPDRTRKQRRAVEIRRDDRVTFRVRSRDRTENLRHRPAAVPRGTGPVGTIDAVGRLLLEPRPVDRPPVEPRWGSRLEPRHRQIGGAELLGKPVRPGLADASTLHPFLAAEQLSAEEGARRQYDRSRDQHRAVAEFEAFDARTVGGQLQCRRLARDHRNAVFGCEQRLNRIPVQLAVGLDTRPLHRRTFRCVEHPVVDRGAVGGARHPAVERIDLAHQMPLAEPSDRRVARHRADQRRIEADERHARTKPRRSRRGLGSGVPTANDDDIENFWIVHDCCAFSAWNAANPPRREAC